MGQLNDIFGFSRAQLRFVAALSSLVLLLSVVSLVRAYTQPAPDSVPLPVLLGPAEPSYTGTFVLDPNTAPVDSLELLPGIGPVLAERIVEAREEARFVNRPDLMRVKGIGPVLYERLEPYLEVKPW